MRFKTTLINGVFLLVIILVSNSCECVVKPNCAGEFYFNLIDKSTGNNLLKGPDAKYTLDAVRAFTSKDSGLYHPQIWFNPDSSVQCGLSGSSDTV